MKDGERVREAGILESFQLPQTTADEIVLQARIAAGWIEAPVVEEVEGGGEGEDAGEGAEPA